MRDIYQKIATKIEGAVNTQYIEVKSLNTGVPFEVAEDTDQLIGELAMIKRVSDSKKFGPTSRKMVL